MPLRLLGFLLAVLFISSGCTPKTIRIGFVGGLTGTMSELGVSGRNGATLRLEEANSSKEVRGTVLKLLTEDDRNSPEAFRAAVDSLVAEGISVAIGPYTSAMANLASRDGRILFLSPTATAASLFGRDDMLFMLGGSNSAGARALGEKVASSLGVKSAALIYDSDNHIYSDDYSAAFESAFEAAGGRITASATFSSSAKNMPFEPILTRLFADRPSCLLVIANGSDTALIVRRAKLLRPGVLILASAWAATSDLLKFGGQVAEGVLIDGQYDPADTSPRYLQFISAYSKRFGYLPSFSSLYSYEAADTLIRVLRYGDKPARIKERLLSDPKVHGLQGDYSFDRFGDATGKVRIYIVHGDALQRL